MSDNLEARKGALLRRRRSDLTAQEMKELYDLKHSQKPRVGRDADLMVWYWGRRPELLKAAWESSRRTMETNKENLLREEALEKVAGKRDEEKKATKASRNSNRKSPQPLSTTYNNTEADFLDLLEPEKFLTVFTHYHGNISGTSLYYLPLHKEDKDLFWDENDTRSRTDAVFDQKSQSSKGILGKVYEKAVLLIEDILLGLPVDGPVVLLCKVKSGKYLPNLVGAEIFDPLFNSRDYLTEAGCWKKSARADMELC